MSTIRPIQTGQTIAGLVRQANPTLSDAEVIKLTQQIMGQIPQAKPEPAPAMPSILDPLGILSQDGQKAGPMGLPNPLGLPMPPMPFAPAAPPEPKGPLEMMANGVGAVVEGAGKGLGSVLEGAGKAVGNFFGGLFGPDEPPRPALPQVTPKNLFRIPPQAFPQQNQGVIIQQQQTLNAQALATISPEAARQLAITGNFQTSRAFAISGQQFLPFANPNIILRNAQGGIPQQ